MKKRWLSLVVAFLMIFSILPVQPAMADEENSTAANPAFTVQYYANLEMLSHEAKSGYHKLHVINATNGLPVNGKEPATHPIYLKDVGNGKMEMATETVLTEVYMAESFVYKDAPSIYYFDKLAQNGNYELDEIWMLKEGRSASSINPSDWTVYDAQTEFHFTNRPATAGDEALQSHNFILIEDGDVIRLVYETADAKYSKEANLYDYDISDGNIYKSTDINSENTYADLAEAKASGKRYYMYTAQQGINSDGNYSGTGTKLAFGNTNTRTGMGKLKWKDRNGKTNTPNQANSIGYDWCTFGLVSGLDKNGNIIYSKGIVAPKLFEEGDAVGKKVYDGGILEFRQDGDTFTLSGVSMSSPDGTSKVPLLGGLERFNNPSPYAGKVYTHIFTNNFWVMDKMTDGDFAFGHTDELDTRWCYGQEEDDGDLSEKALPQSDDGKNHNSYFGMSYTVEFGLSEDYIGPLEWVFYGDDDLWVFLDGQLICDIGGVHSSVGQYVDMWKYLEAERQRLLADPDEYSSTHTLKIFYTERGASGSTCYMRFSLPSVSIIHPISTTGQLKVSKDVLTTGTNGIEDEFDFTIRFRDTSGQPLLDDYVYDKYKVGETVPYERDLVIWDNGTFSLKDDEYIIIKYLPGGTTYSIEEIADDDYISSAEGNNGTIVVDQTQQAQFTNTRKGTITVSKTVEGNEEDKTKDFAFTVTLGDTSINGIYGDMTFVNGVARFTLKDGESKTADRLPIGITYNVEETPNTDYDTTWEGQISGTIEAGGIYDAAFTNSRRGSLTVEKIVEGGTDKNKQQSFDFTVSLSDTTINGTYGDMTFVDGVAQFTLKHGESKTALELPAHITYTVEETSHENYETTVPNNAAGSIIPAGDQKVVFVNTSKLGDLLVTKVVSDNAVHKDEEFTFVVTLDDATVNGTFGEMEFTNGVAEFTLKHGESKKAEGIPAGTAYVVTEEEKDLYIATYENEEGQIIAGETIEATVTNEHKVGSLTVQKQVTGTSSETDRDFNFTVVLSDTGINGTFGEMTFVDGVAQFTLKHGESKTAEGILAGVGYEVIEEVHELYTASYENEEGQIADGEVVVVTVINDRKVGSVTVEKQVTGTSAETDRDFEFTLILSDTSINGIFGDMTFVDGVAQFTLKHGEKKTATGLPSHITYTVEETPHENYETIIPDNASGTIEPEGDQQVVFVNSRKLGDLLVTKVVSDNAVHKNEEFSFVVTLDDTTINGTFGEMEFTNGVAQFTLKHGESKRAEGIPSCVVYRVTEYVKDTYIVSYENREGQIIAEETIEATVTNEHKLGGLSVEKKVTGTAGELNRHFNFTVVLSDTSINGTYGEMTFVDGVARFRLKHGEKITAEGLLAGMRYEVIEEAVNGYHVISMDSKGTIPAEDIQEVKFQNHKDIEPPKEIPTSPPTGDSAPVATWFATALISMAMILGLVWKKRRQ